MAVIYLSRRRHRSSVEGTAGGSENWPCKSVWYHTPFLCKSRSLSCHTSATETLRKSHPPAGPHQRFRLDWSTRNKTFSRVHQESFNSPSLRNASLRDSSVAPLPENCTVMPWGRNMEAGLRRWSGDGARWAFETLIGPW